MMHLQKLTIKWKASIVIILVLSLFVIPARTVTERLQVQGALAAPTTLDETVGCGASAADDLIQAITDVETAGGGTITLTTGCTYTLTAENNDNAGPNGLPAIGSTIIIEGQNAAITREGSAPNFRFFYVTGTLTLNQLTLSGAHAEGDGGAVYNDGGTVYINNSTLQSNEAGVAGSVHGNGGAVANNGGTVEVANSTLTGNTANGDGGALVCDGGTVSISQSSLAGNAANGGVDEAQSHGGAFDVQENGAVTVDRSLLDNNQADYGGAVFTGKSSPSSSGTATVTNSTISNNTADSNGGAIRAFSGSVSLNSVTVIGNTPDGVTKSVTARNTLLADNNDKNCADLSGGGMNHASNMQSNDSSNCGANVSKEALADLHLGALADNGGPTLTYALETGSAAIDAGDNAEVSGLADQRGKPRTDNGTVDVGAYEYQTAFTFYDFASATFSVAEGDDTHSVTVVEVVRSGDTSVASSVEVVLADGTAVAGTDYTAGPVQVDFAIGETTKPAPIEILGNTDDESDKTIDLSMQNPSSGSAIGITQTTAELTLSNDDTPTYNFSAATFSTPEGDTTHTVTVVEVLRTGDTSGASSVDVALADNTAIAGTDYTAGPVQVDFAVDEATKSVPIEILGDEDDESDKVIDLSLENPSAGTGVGATQPDATLTLTNDDTPPTYDFSAATFSAAEGNSSQEIYVVTVLRSGDTTIASEVDVVLAGDTATPGMDYTAGPVTLHFAIDDTTKTVPITVLGDTIVEVDETINLSFENFTDNGKNGTTQPTAVLTLTNDDADAPPPSGNGGGDTGSGTGAGSGGGTTTTTTTTTNTVTSVTLPAYTGGAGAPQITLPDLEGAVVRFAAVPVTPYPVEEVLNVRTYPTGARHEENVVARLKDGDLVHILDVTPFCVAGFKWYGVRTEAGISGWMSSNIRFHLTIEVPPDDECIYASDNFGP